MNNSKENEFQELVTWATWRMMEGLTQGTPLRELVFQILVAARNSAPAAPTKAKK
jgi:hypothetical protein